MLGIPFQEVTQAALITVAYYRGETFRPVERCPMDDVVRNRW